MQYLYCTSTAVFMAVLTVFLALINIDQNGWCYSDPSPRFYLWSCDQNGTIRIVGLQILYGTDVLICRSRGGVYNQVVQVSPHNILQKLFDHCCKIKPIDGICMLLQLQFYQFMKFQNLCLLIYIRYETFFLTILLKEIIN